MSLWSPAQTGCVSLTPANHERICCTRLCRTAKSGGANEMGNVGQPLRISPIAKEHSRLQRAVANGPGGPREPPVDTFGNPCHRAFPKKALPTAHTLDLRIRPQSTHPMVASHTISPSPIYPAGWEGAGCGFVHTQFPWAEEDLQLNRGLTVAAGAR